MASDTDTPLAVVIQQRPDWVLRGMLSRKGYQWCAAITRTDELSRASCLSPCSSLAFWMWSFVLCFQSEGPLPVPVLGLLCHPVAQQDSLSPSSQSQQSSRVPSFLWGYRWKGGRGHMVKGLGYLQEKSWPFVWRQWGDMECSGAGLGEYLLYAELYSYVQNVWK